MHQHRSHLGLLCIAVILAQDRVLATAEASSAFESLAGWAGQQVLGAMGASGLAQLHPSILRVIDAVSVKRRSRGDSEGAARMEAMRQWVSWTGLRKGLPALGLQLLNSKQVVTDIVKTVTTRTQAFQTRAAAVGVMDTWQEQQKDIARDTNKIISRLAAAFKSGPARQLLDDMLLEVQADTYLARDILEEVLPASGSSQGMITWLQELFTSLRTILERELTKVKQKTQTNKEL